MINSARQDEPYTFHPPPRPHRLRDGQVATVKPRIERNEQSRATPATAMPLVRRELAFQFHSIICGCSCSFTRQLHPGNSSPRRTCPMTRIWTALPVGSCHLSPLFCYAASSRYASRRRYLDGNVHTTSDYTFTPPVCTGEEKERRSRRRTARFPTPHTSQHYGCAVPVT